MGASSRSPSPITTVPRMLRKLNALRMASTAAWSASFSSPRPITRADAIAAASVSRTASRPMFLSIALPPILLRPTGLRLHCSVLPDSARRRRSRLLRVQSPDQPVRRARGPAFAALASVYGVSECPHRIVSFAMHLVLEADLHPRVRLREVDPDEIVVAGRFQVIDRGLVHRQQDAARLDLAVAHAQSADVMGARPLEETEVVGVIHHAHLVGVAVDDAHAVRVQAGSGHGPRV